MSGVYIYPRNVMIETLVPQQHQGLTLRWNIIATIMKAKKCHPTDTMNGYIWGPMGQSVYLWHGPLARYVKLRVRMRRECRERFPRHRRWAIPTCITARAWRTCRDACRDRQLSVSFEIGGGGKRSRHSRRMRNLQFYVSGKRSMDK